MRDPNPEVEDDDDPWLRQFLAGQQAKEQRARPLMWGCIPLLILVPLMFFLAMFGARGADPKLPPGMTCEQVQAHYAQWSYLGKGVIRAWLILNGHSRADTREAEKCLNRNAR